MDAAAKRQLDALKAALKKAHKTVEAGKEFIGNKIANNILKSKPVSDVNSRNVK